MFKFIRFKFLTFTKLSKLANTFKTIIKMSLLGVIISFSLVFRSKGRQAFRVHFTYLLFSFRSFITVPV